jgi:hypothetical protein
VFLDLIEGLITVGSLSDVFITSTKNLATGLDLHGLECLHTKVANLGVGAVASRNIPGIPGDTEIHPTNDRHMRDKHKE